MALRGVEVEEHEDEDEEGDGDDESGSGTTSHGGRRGVSRVEVDLCAQEEVVVEGWWEEHSIGGRCSAATC